MANLSDNNSAEFMLSKFIQDSEKILTLLAAVVIRFINQTH